MKLLLLLTILALTINLRSCGQDEAKDNKLSEQPFNPCWIKTKPPPLGCKPPKPAR